MFVPLVLFCITSTSCFKYFPESQDRFSFTSSRHSPVVKGSDVPHHVLVVYDKSYCSGSLIFSRIVLTVASCFVRPKSEKCSVKVGSNTITGMGQIFAVIEKKIHEYYNHRVPHNNDIALLMLELFQNTLSNFREWSLYKEVVKYFQRSVTFGRAVKKTVLLGPDTALREGVTLEVAGWGSNDLGQKYSNQLLLSEMKIISIEECEQTYGGLITLSKYCAKYQPVRRLSDHGGSAIYRRTLVGILSYGATSSNEEDCIALITNVSYFNRWIILNSKRLLLKHCIEETEESEYDHDDV